MHFVARARELLMSDDVTSRIVVTFRFGFFFSDAIQKYVVLVRVQPQKRTEKKRLTWKIPYECNFEDENFLYRFDVQRKENPFFAQKDEKEHIIAYLDCTCVVCAHCTYNIPTRKTFDCIQYLSTYYR